LISISGLPFLTKPHASQKYFVIAGSPLFQLNCTQTFKHDVIAQRSKFRSDAKPGNPEIATLRRCSPCVQRLKPEPRSDMVQMMESVAM
jgi:hypothetical protein